MGSVYCGPSEANIERPSMSTSMMCTYRLLDCQSYNQDDPESCMAFILNKYTHTCRMCYGLPNTDTDSNPVTLLPGDTFYSCKSISIFSISNSYSNFVSYYLSVSTALIILIPTKTVFLTYLNYP